MSMNLSNIAISNLNAADFIDVLLPELAEVRSFDWKKTEHYKT